jgi:ribonuclease D
MSHIHIQRIEDATDLEATLGAAGRIALDCEAAGFHRYSDRLCLLQLSLDERTYVIDPLAFDPGELLKGPLEDPELTVVMHGADFDLRLLKRDLGIRLAGLFDTQVAAALLGEEALGLAALLESRLGVTLSKKYQRADWAQRPLKTEMLEYAADDTRHLLGLADELMRELVEAGRVSWAEEEWLALEAVADQNSDASHDEDPVVRVKGARDLTPREVSALRRALAWRDRIARERDRAPFRVVGDRPLVEAVVRRPGRLDDLKAIKGFSPTLARDEGPSLLEALRAVRELPEAELEGYPRHARRGPARPPPEVEQLVDRLKAIRNRRAEEIGLPRGTLVSNAVMLAIAHDAPQDLAALVAIDGMRRWKADVVGAEFLEAVRRQG